MSFVVTNAKMEWLTRPAAIGESIGWTRNPEAAWEFDTRSGAEKASLIYGGSRVWCRMKGPAVNLQNLARPLHVPGRTKTG